jgi:hypothetical protein
MSAPSATTTDDLIRRLEEAAAAFNHLSTNHPASTSWSDTDAEGWSAQDVTAHMRASDDILIPRVYQVLTRDNPPLPAFDERRWAEIAGYADVPPEAHVGRIVIRWFELVQLLRGLSSDAWQRSGEHEVAGDITLESIVTHLVGHAEEHISQIDAMLTSGG